MVGSFVGIDGHMAREALGPGLGRTQPDGRHARAVLSWWAGHAWAAPLARRASLAQPDRDNTNDWPIRFYFCVCPRFSLVPSSSIILLSSTFLQTPSSGSTCHPPPLESGDARRDLTIIGGDCRGTSIDASFVAYEQRRKSHARCACSSLPLIYEGRRGHRP
jgi:hypothetical protein